MTSLMPASFNRFFIIATCFFALSALTSSSFADSSGKKEAPDFSLPNLVADGTINLKDFKGRVVYLDFWATWCPPCRKSFPWMEKMHTRYQQDGLTIIAISVDGKREVAKEFALESNTSFITAHDPGKETARLYKLRAMPSSYLIDRDGNIISTHLGFRTSKTKKLEAEFREALKQ